MPYVYRCLLPGRMTWVGLEIYGVKGGQRLTEVVLEQHTLTYTHTCTHTCTIKTNWETQ